MAYTPNAAALAAATTAHTTAVGVTTQVQLDQLDAAMALRAIDTAVSHLAGLETFSGKKTFNAGQDNGGQLLTGVLTPAASTDAANKAYVDAATAGTANQKPAGVVVNRANVAALSGLPTTDGVTLTDNQRILLVGQTTQAQNGPWLVHAGAWVRPPDFAAASVQNGVSMYVESGTVDATSGWLMTNAANVTVDTTAQTWVQINGTADVVAGPGLAKSGTNQLQVSVACISRTGASTSLFGQTNLCDATSASFALTLPAVASNMPRITVKKTDASANTITVTPASGTIDGAASFIVSVRYQSVDLACDGTNWFLV